MGTPFARQNAKETINIHSKPSIGAIVTTFILISNYSNGIRQFTWTNELTIVFIGPS